MVLFSRLQILILLVTICSCQSAKVYVHSSGMSPCPDEPCHSLDYYAKSTNHKWMSGMEVVFLPGTHSLGSDLSVTVISVTNLTLTSMNCTLAIVNCSPNSGFEFREVTSLRGYFEISNSLLQYNAGNKTVFGGNMHVFYSPYSHVSATLCIIATHFEHGRNPRNHSSAAGITLMLLCVNSTIDILIEIQLLGTILLPLTLGLVSTQV